MQKKLAMCIIDLTLFHAKNQEKCILLTVAHPHDFHEKKRESRPERAEMIKMISLSSNYLPFQLIR